MDLKETGKLIAETRKEAGYTQASLAAMLQVSDKAVSKWERGICLPDSSLLAKLSMLLDVEIDYLVSGKLPFGKEKWTGLITVDDVEGEIAGKPLLHYLLSYFLLVGITDICIKTDKRAYVKSLCLERFGIRVSFDETPTPRTAVLFGKFFLYGVNLTRQLRHCMVCGENRILTLGDKEIPFLFSYYTEHGISFNRKKATEKPLGRGTTFIPLLGKSEEKDAALFIETCEKYSGQKIADLAEIAALRGILP